MSNKNQNKCIWRENKCTSQFYTYTCLHRIQCHNTITKCVEKYENKNRKMEKGTGKSHSYHIAWAGDSEKWKRYYGNCYSFRIISFFWKIHLDNFESIRLFYLFLSIFYILAFVWSRLVFFRALAFFSTFANLLLSVNIRSVSRLMRNLVLIVLDFLKYEVQTTQIWTEILTNNWFRRSGKKYFLFGRVTSSSVGNIGKIVKGIFSILTTASRNIKKCYKFWMRIQHQKWIENYYFHKSW